MDQTIFKHLNSLKRSISDVFLSFNSNCVYLLDHRYRIYLIQLLSIRPVPVLKSGHLADLLIQQQSDNWDRR